jgi:hypothetical protein
MDIAAIARMALSAAKMAGAHLPAFQSLASQIATVVGPGRTQDELKSALADARARSDQMHKRVQDAAKGR